MATQTKHSLAPLFAVLAAVIIWGSSFAVMKFAVGYYPPVFVVAVRMIIALIFIIPLLLWVPRPDYRAGDWKFLAAMAFLEPCLYFLLESYALVYTTSSQAGMIAAVVPLLVLVGARLFLNEHMTPFALFGILISVVGVVLLTVAGSPQAGAPDPLFGNFLEFAAMVCAAGYILMLKRMSVRYHGVHLAGVQFFVGSLFFLPGFYLFPVQGDAVTSVQLLLSLLYLGIFTTFGAFVLFAYAISKLPAAQGTAFINLIPVIALLLGWGVMKEQINMVQWGAVVLVMMGVLISQKQSGELGLVGLENTQGPGE